MAIARLHVYEHLQLRKACILFCRPEQKGNRQAMCSLLLSLAGGEGTTTKSWACGEQSAETLCCLAADTSSQEGGASCSGKPLPQVASLSGRQRKQVQGRLVADSSCSGSRRKREKPRTSPGRRRDRAEAARLWTCMAPRETKKLTRTPPQTTSRYCCCLFLGWRAGKVSHGQVVCVQVLVRLRAPTEAEAQEGRHRHRHTWVVGGG